ncbi:MAG TPA: hypothetical protein VK348_03155 [Planctomycetota bacterium]|nr:hypothetical protein [Planctomycetota bacterium]
MTLRVLLPLLLAACTAASPGVHVQHFGVMREVMREGKTEGRVRLADLDLRPGTIAVGALAGLGGEVTIHGHSLYVAEPDGDGVKVVRDAGARAATLLTIGQTEVYERADDPAIVDEASLLRWLHARAAATRLDPQRPRPLVITGMAAEMQLHVVRGACPDEATDPAHAPWRWSAPPGTKVELVGFHAPGQAGVMTHHGTELHLHAIVALGDRVITGHVDHFLLAPGAEVTIGTR